MTTHKCKICDVVFRSKYQTAKYCSDRCFMKRHSPLLERDCDICGKHFRVGSGNALRCSAKCRRVGYELSIQHAHVLSAARRCAPYTPVGSKRTCDMCHSAFTISARMPWTLRCSATCRRLGRKISMARAQKSEKSRMRNKRYNSDPRRAMRRKLPENRKKKRAYMREYIKTHPEARLWQVLRATMIYRIGVPAAGLSRYTKYTGKQLKAHIGKMFLPGMSWDNYGVHGWHIDHVTPLKAFTFFTKSGKIRFSEIHKAMALSNLQPLWAIDNLRKGSRMPTASDKRSEPLTEVIR